LLSSSDARAAGSKHAGGSKAAQEVASVLLQDRRSKSNQ